MAESGVVGLDLGPSTLAAVSDDTAFLKGFCEELEPLGREKQILQRRLDRSRRLTNPQCFNDDGTWKKR
jgi:transposase